MPRPAPRLAHRRSLAADLAKAVRDEQELQREIASINAEVEAEKLVQAAAKERLAILLDVEQVRAASHPTMPVLGRATLRRSAPRLSAPALLARLRCQQPGHDLDGDHARHSGRLARGGRA